MSLKPMEIDFRRTFMEMIGETAQGTSAGAISARFHNTLVDALAQACIAIRSRLSSLRSPIITPHASPKVCLSGGCFQNALLSQRLKKRLEDAGFEVYTHSLVPPNDGCIALGQAAVAGHRERP